jgi:4-hydroxythreonine-4-phosphate dehydrogenase
MGDPAGIGLDITLAAWRDRARLALPPFLFVGDAEALRQRARALGVSVAIAETKAPREAIALSADDRLPVYPVAVGVAPVPGKPEPRNAAAVIRAIEIAVALVADGSAAAVVTNPIAKAVLYDAGFRHPGHTEFLAELAARHWPGKTHRSVMMLASDDLRVVPLTVHIPLAEVPRAISRSLIIDTVRITADALARDFRIVCPRIAIAGLNPHAGEGGAIGREEMQVILPAIAELKSSGLRVTGPHAADTLFHERARAAYDAVIAMYHDQALIPLKTLAFDEGVNVTLGLPFVRTSPDHGTAFGIAGSGEAKPESFIASLRFAQKLSAARAASLA